MKRAKKRKTRSRPRIGTTVESAPIKKYEYNHLEIQIGVTAEDVTSQLNALGLEGWLAYHAFESGGFYHFLFTREVV